MEYLLELIWDLANCFAEIIFVYTPRGCNSIADKIAKYARISGTSSDWIDMIPDWLCNLVGLDRFSLARVA